MSKFCRAKETVLKKIRHALTVERVLACAVLSPLFFLALQFFVLNVFDLFGTTMRTTLRYVTIGLTALAFCSSLFTVLRRSFRFASITYAVVILVLVASYCIFPSNWPYIREALFPLLFISVPVMVYVYSVRDHDVFMRAVLYTSCAIGILAGSTGIIKLWSMIDGRLYSMTLAYYLLFPCIVLIRGLFRKFSLIRFLCLLLLLLLIVAKGSRGPMGAVIAFVLIMTVSPQIVLHSDRRSNLILKGAVLLLLAGRSTRC